MPRRHSLMLATSSCAWYDGAQEDVFCMRYDAVIYDLDGTLLNTLDDLAASVNHALTLSGLPTHSTEAVCAMVGNGMEKLIRRALPADATEELYTKVMADFRAHYSVHSDDQTCLYPGIAELLEEMHQLGVAQAILSNKGDPYVKDLSRKYFERWITVAYGERVGIPRKPHPEATLGIVREWGFDPSRVLYVGDSDVDILTGKNAGLDAASVCWGFRTEEQLKEAGAEHLFHDPKELAAFIKGE